MNPAREAIREFGLHAASGFRWKVAADWLEDRGESHLATMFRGIGHLLEKPERVANGRGHGDGNGTGDYLRSAIRTRSDRGQNFEQWAGRGWGNGTGG